MKRIISAFILMLLISACSNNNINESNQIDSKTTEIDRAQVETKDLENPDTEVEDILENDEITQLAEYNTLSDTINLSENTISIVEDRDEKRVLLIKDENGHEKYKSIFFKHKNRLKIIEFNRGQIFNEII